MIRRCLLVAIAAASLVVPESAGAAQGAHSACQRLKAKHDLAPAKRAKLVEHGNDDGGTSLLGCVLPNGRLITVASTSDFYTPSSEYAVDQVAGHHVLVSSRAMGKNGGFDDTYVVDVKKGRSYKIASFCHEGLTTYCDSDSDATVVRAFINSGGQAAALIHSEGGGVADVRRFEVRGFDSHGKTMLLDYGRGGEIAASSLKLQGNLVTWTHSGVERAGRVGRSRCQRLRADRDLAPAKRVKLVRRRAMGGGSELVGCILPRGSVNLIEYAEPGYVSRFSVRQVAGHHVLVGTYDANQIGDHRQTYVFDLRRAAEYAVAESCGPPDSSCGTQDTADAAFVNATGQAAALLHGVYTDEVTVVGFTSRGERMVLDSGTKPEIPASSLALDEHEVTWTHSGAPKSATLSG